MKSIWKLLAVSLFFSILLAGSVSALANPAAVYCKELGYDYEVRSGVDGEYGVCTLPNGEDCAAWSFFEGKCGQAYSYCARNGYAIKTVSDESGSEHAVCIPRKYSLNRYSADAPILFEETPVAEAMNLGEKISNDLKALSDLTHYKTVSPRSFPNFGAPLAATFDWRDYNNENWITSVKDQESCGSCWAFSVAGALEAKYNIEQNNSRLDPDLSEQSSVSCDPYNGKCDGGNMELNLIFTQEYGIVDEACFPYIDANGICSNICPDYAERMWSLTSYTYEEDLNDTQLKEHLVDYGPAIIGLGIGGLFNGSDYFDENNTLRCLEDGQDHAVVLVGYNDTGSYWIVKNSWGDYKGGYLQVGYGECDINEILIYVSGITTPSYKPSISLNSPAANYSSSNTIVDFNFTVSNRNSTQSTCDLTVNDSAENTSSTVSNGTSTVLSANLSEGSYEWNISCWEANIGIVNTSETRTLLVDLTAPTIYLESPGNNTWAGNSTPSVQFNVSDASTLTCTLYFNSTAYNTSAVSRSTSTSLTVNTSLSEGVWNWWVNCTDSAGWENKSIVRVLKVDSTNPNIDFASNSDTAGVYSRNWTFINITFNDAGSGVDTAILYLYNTSGLVLNLSNDTSSFSYNFTNLLDAVYWINASVNDSAGNTNSTSTLVVTLDTTNPVTVLSSPVNSYNTSSQSIIFVCNATDNLNLSAIALYGNWSAGVWGANESKSATGTSSSKNFSKTLDEGSYTWNCFANDTAGNSAFQATNRTIFVDLSNPDLYSVNLSSSSINRSESINFTVNASDNLGIASVVLNISDNTYSLSYDSGAALYWYYWNSTDFSTINYNYTVTATDLASRTNSSTSSFEVMEASYSNQTALLQANNTTIVLFTSVIKISHTVANNVTNSTTNVKFYTSDPNQTTIPTNKNETGRYYEITVDSEIANNLTVSTVYFYYNQTLLTANDINESTLEAYKYNGTAWVQVSNSTNSVQDTTNNYIAVNLTSFSLYTLFGVENTEETVEEEQQTGGGGGGGAGGTPLPTESASFGSITAGETSTKTYAKANDIYISQIALTMSEDTKNAIVQVIRYLSKPVSIPDPDNPAFAYMGITGFNFQSADLENAVMKFRVNNTWIEENNIDTDTVKLMRLVNSSWTELPTELSFDGAQWMYYTAETTGFSYFAITGEEKSEAEAEQTVVQENLTEDVNKTVVVEEEIVEDVQEKTSWWLLITLVLLALSALSIPIYVYIKKKTFPELSKKENASETSYYSAE